MAVSLHARDLLSTPSLSLSFVELTGVETCDTGSIDSRVIGTSLPYDFQLLLFHNLLQRKTSQVLLMVSLFIILSLEKYVQKVGIK